MKMPIKNGNKPEIIGIKPELKIALAIPFELWGQIKWSICLVMPCGSIRNLSHLSFERSSLKTLYPYLFGGDSTLWGKYVRSTATSTSHYKDLMVQFSNVMNTRHNDVYNVISGAGIQTNCLPSLDGLNISMSEGVQTLRNNSQTVPGVNSNGTVYNIDATHSKDFTCLNFSSQAHAQQMADNGEDTQDSTLNKKSDKTKADHSDLEKIKDYYIEKIPYLYKSGEDYTLGFHHEDIAFENNYFEQQKICKGIVEYQKEQTKLRVIAMLKFPSYFFQPVGATTHYDESCVKLHWRFYYIRNIEFFTKYLVKRIQGVHMLDCLNTADGISTIYVNKDGKIIKHQVDRLLPIQKGQAVIQPKIGSRLASLMGLAPTPKTNFKKDSKLDEKPQPQS